MKYIIFFVLLALSFNVFSQDKDSFHEALSHFSEDEKAEILLGAGDPINLFNFVSGETETILRIDRISAEKFSEFIPPLDEAQAMYKLYLSHDLVPYDAYSQTMVQLMITLTN